MVLHTVFHQSPNTEAAAVPVSHQEAFLQTSTATPVAVNRGTDSWGLLGQ